MPDVRRHASARTPGSKLRVSVLDVLKSEGYIRGYSTVEHKDGRSEIEVELKYFDGAPVIHHPKRISDIPTQSEISVRLSKDLKARGFKFCGPPIVYAFMQAVGMVNDHLVDCHRYAQWLSTSTNFTTTRRRRSVCGRRRARAVCTPRRQLA